MPRGQIVKVTTVCGHVYLATYDAYLRVSPKVTCSPGGRAGGLQPPVQSFVCATCKAKAFKAKRNMTVGELDEKVPCEWVASVERIS